YGRAEKERLGCDWSEEPELLEAAAHRVSLLVVRLDEREPASAHVVAEQVERTLDRDRVWSHAQEVDRRAQLLVQRARGFDITGAEQPDHLLHLRADDMRVHANAAEAADLQEREDDVVVSGVEVESGLDDRARLSDVRVRLLDGADVRDLREFGDGPGLEVE